MYLANTHVLSIIYKKMMTLQLTIFESFLNSVESLRSWALLDQTLKMPSVASTMLHASWASGALAIQPWLNTSLNYEQRLQSFISQLNLTQKLAMVQGDTVVS